MSNDDFHQGRYALRVMLDLAEHCADGYIPLKEIAHRQADQHQNHSYCHTVHLGKIQHNTQLVCQPCIKSG